jgi:hypothetical protein
MVALPPQRLRTHAGQQSWVMWTIHELLVVGPMRPTHGCKSASYDHLRHRCIGWMVMAHHESHCGALIHLHKMHFQFGVIRTWVLATTQLTSTWLHPHLLSESFFNGPKDLLCIIRHTSLVLPATTLPPLTLGGHHQVVRLGCHPKVPFPHATSQQ